MAPTISSTIDPSIPYLEPIVPSKNSPKTENLVKSLGLLVHTEGGYFKELDRDPLIIPNPFNQPQEENDKANATRTALAPRSGEDAVRHASTTIYYLLSKERPFGVFHRNKARTVHTVVRGRGRYVLIHADEPENEHGKKRIETFMVGNKVEEGERGVWIVEGGKFKASFLAEGEEELLITEVRIHDSLFRYCCFTFFSVR
jgi:predicted cupin superfamily sugar epimerase